MVVFACLPNFICDSIDPKSHDRTQGLSEAISRHLEVVKTYALSNPTKLVVAVQPLARQSPAWFFTDYLLMLDLFNALFVQKKQENMYHFTVQEYKKLQFTGDLVHLTPKCGDSYVYSLFEQAGELFDNVAKYSSTVASSTASASASTSNQDPLSMFKKAVNVDDSDSDSYLSLMDSNDGTDVNDTTLVGSITVSTPTPTVSTPVTLELLYSEIKKNNESLVSKVNSHDQELLAVKDLVCSGFKSTDLAIARMYDDQDFSVNVSKENRVTIGSMVLSEPSLPTDRASWIKFLTAKINSFISDLFKTDAALVPVLIGVAVRSTRLNFKKEFPNFDAIFQNPAHALAFRRTIIFNSRQPDSPYRALFVSNSVTLATRVRIEVMLALSRYLN